MYVLCHSFMNHDVPFVPLEVCIRNGGREDIGNALYPVLSLIIPRVCILFLSDDRVFDIFYIKIESTGRMA